MRRGLHFSPIPLNGNRRSGMIESELRRKFRAFGNSGLFFRLLTR